MDTPEQKTILSGMRPTGPLHLGNLVGALQNWVKLQDKYQCYFEIADLHALTDRTDTADIARNRIEVMLDWLAAGLDPHRAVLFIQSDVAEHALLYCILGMFVPVSWLERVPTYKERVKELNLGESASFGLLGYPVLQAVDIAIYKADVVPVGEDQLPHLELTREIVRRFNHFFGDVFVEPQALLTEVPRLPGLDGRKMSKSYGNAIYLKDSDQEIREKVQTMFTDPKRLYRRDPGHPHECNVYAYRILFDAERSGGLEYECTHAQLGCTDCKMALASALAAFVAPYRERREGYERDLKTVTDILDDGARRAREVARATYEEAFDAVKLGREG